MERLAEQIVDWHNRHPLARRIGVGDVHTIGVVALPFVRATAQEGGVVEPVLTDAVSAFDELAGSPPLSRWAAWGQRLRELPRRFGQPARTQWRAFSENFLPGLSAARIERFALAHGFTEAPATPQTRPWRVIVIDEALAARHSGWPFEIYLMSAGIDVGEARTRVLSGRGIPSQVIGRRLWDPKRIAAAAALAAVLAAVAAWSLWPSRPAEPVAPPATASAAASAAASAIDVAVPASAALAASEAAPLPMAEASSAGAPPAEDAASAVPDIRPRLVERADGRVLPPLRGGSAAPPAEAASAAPRTPPQPAAEMPAPRLTESPAAQRPGAAPDPRLARLSEAPALTAVALVGPPGSKADAEALLKKMREGLAGVHGNPDALQADVIETPEGWRATIWPFPSREQAQLINATLVARGLKTKAVNF
jgi:hypothetical protein